MNMNATDTDKM